jgi:hypothetical protein
MKHMVKQHGVILSTTYSKHAGLAHFVCFVVFIVLLMALPPVARAIEIDPELEEKFEANGATGYAIYFRAKANLSEAPKTGWKEQSEFVNKALQDTANQSQARVRSYLFSRRVPYRSLWKENIIIVDKSDRDTLQGLQYFSEIEAIRTGLKTEPKDSKKTEPANTTGTTTTTNKP